MPINVRQEFSSVGLAAGPGVFAPAPLPSGALEATRATGGATLEQLRVRADGLARQAAAEQDRGAALGRLGPALGAAGEALAHGLAAIDARRGAARQRAQAATARAAFVREAGDLAGRAATAHGADARGLRAGVAARLDARRRDLLARAGIEDEALRRALAEDLERIAARAEIAAGRQEAALEGRQLREGLRSRVGVLAAAASGLAGGAEQAALLRLAVDDVRDGVDEGVLDAVAGERLVAGLRRRTLQATLEQLAASDPGRGLALLADGALAHLFADASERAAAAARLTQAQATQRARREAELDAAIAADLAARRAGAPGRGGLRAAVRQAGGATAVAAYDRARAAAEAEGADALALRWAPPAQVAELLAPLQAAAGADPAARQRYAAALQTLAARARQLAGDPAGYVARHPAVGSRAQNMALQRALGLTMPAVFSQAEAAAAVQAYRQADDDGKLGLLDGWLREAGAHRGTALRSLLAAGLPPSAEVLMLQADDAARRPVLAQVLAAERQGRKALEAALTAEEGAAVRAAVDEALAPFGDSTRAMGGAGARLAAQAGHTVLLLALALAAGGAAPDRAGQAAADRLINDHFSYRDGYRVPARFDADAVARHASAVLATLADGPGARPGARWATAADGEGLVLADAAGAPVTDGDGRPVGLGFAAGEAGGFLRAAGEREGGPAGPGRTGNRQTEDGA